MFLLFYFIIYFIELAAVTLLSSHLHKRGKSQYPSSKVLYIAAWSFISFNHTLVTGNTDHCGGLA